MARQALEAGLFDDVDIELVPVVLGSGKPLVPGLGATGAARGIGGRGRGRDPPPLPVKK